MKKTFPFSKIIIPLLAVGLACAQTSPELTPSSGLTPEVSPTAPIDASITTPPLNAILPPTLAGSASSSVTTEVEFPYINPSVGEMPVHSKYLLENYLLVDALHPPHVLVFRAADYATYSELTSEAITALEAFINTPGEVPPEPLYTGIVTAQVQAIQFQNGSGIRYLTQSGQAPAPVNNHALFYYFQGLTNDREYYVTALLPTSISYLAVDEDPASPLPVDGIPFDFNNFDSLPQYFEAVSQKLNATSPDAFVPALTLLDEFIQSFLIQP